MALVGATAVAPGMPLTPFGGVTEASAAANTVVSIEFDDGYDRQYQTRAILNARGLKATYYVNSGTQPPDYSTLSWAQLHQLANDGHEIGGHTINHPDLTSLTTAQATAEICNDRSAIQAQGFTVRSFAYPYGKNNTAVQNIARNCGYTSARDVVGVGCDGCPAGESIPPANAMKTRTPENVNQDMSVAQMQAMVTNAENNGGGWVQLVFHDVCIPGGNCDFYSITPANFTTLMDWIANRPSTTVVRTVGDVIAGTTPPDTTAPTSTIACNGAACANTYYNAPVQVSLAATDNAGGSGVASIRYTTDGSTPSLSSASYTAPFSVSPTKTVRYRAYDVANNAEATKSQLVQVDTTAPASSIKCNAVACSASVYGPPVQVTLSGTDTGGSGFAAVRYTTDGSDPTISSPLYSAPFNLSATTMVKYRAWDNAGNAEATHATWIAVDADAPISSVACNGTVCAGWYGAPVQVSMSAVDNGGSGLDALRYTTNGADPTVASPSYSTPFAVPVTTTVKNRAWDHAGNAEAPKTQPISIDSLTPTAGIKCNGGPCSSGWSRGPVHVTLSATDTGGSGVAAIRYTTDGSTPTAASRAYSGPFKLSASKTVKFRAVDNAGKASGVTPTLVRVDLGSPTVSITSPAKGASVTGNVKIAVKANDSVSGVARVTFSVDGRLVATDTTAAYAYVWNTAKASKTTHKLTVKAVDRAGNSTSKSISVRVR